MTRAIKIGLWAIGGLAILFLLLFAMAGNLARGQSNISPPVILPTTTLQKGTGVGNYTTASTTLVPVDSTNQCLATVTIPVGFKLLVSAAGSATSATAAVVVTLALTDNASCATANAGVLQSVQLQPPAASAPVTYAMNWVITGDGNVHNVALQYDTAAAADLATILNSAATLAPMMTFQLVKSN